MDFLRNLDEDIIVHRIGLYSVKRYAYKKYNYIDNDGKDIDERVFSFILMHGPRWFNQTSLNFKESELGDVIQAYENIVSKMTIERKAELTIERAARKLFPRKHEFIFENVTIVAIERPCYYTQGIARSTGSYFEKDEKIVEFYANGFPYRSDAHVNVDTVIDLEFILDRTIKNDIQKHYTRHDFSGKYYASETSMTLKFRYIPMIYILGYVYELDGKQIEFYNYSSGRFETKPEAKVSLLQIMSEGKLVGELQGMKAWGAMLNKVKFV